MSKIIETDFLNHSFHVEFFWTLRSETKEMLQRVDVCYERDIEWNPSKQK